MSWDKERIAQIQLPDPADDDPHPRLLLEGRGIRRCGQTAGYAVGLCHYAEGFPTPDRPGAVAQVAFGPHEGR